MPRISGVNIPDNKKIEYALPYLYGIGRTLAKKVLTEAKIDFNKRAKTLTVEEINRLHAVLDKNYKIEEDLRREKTLNIKRLKDIRSYRGIRHARGLPVRGQRTKTNSRTRRGNVRKTVGSGKVKTEKK